MPSTKFFPRSVPASVRCSSWPRSWVPMKAAMITMKKANMIAWLKPTAMVGSASGNCTCQSFWRRVAPAMSAASVSSTGTLRKPSIV